MLQSRFSDEEGLNSVSEETSFSTDLVQETKRRLRTLEAEADVSPGLEHYFWVFHSPQKDDQSQFVLNRIWSRITETSRSA